LEDIADSAQVDGIQALMMATFLRISAIT